MQIMRLRKSNEICISVRMTTSIVILLLAFAVACTSAANTEGDSDQPIISHDCKVKEPIYGHEFDLNGLHSDLAHVVGGGVSKDVFEFNTCGNLTRVCNNESNVSACMKRNGKEYILGRQQELIYQNGQMYFQYTSGEKCENGTTDNPNYQLHVKLSCDYTLDPVQFHIIAYADNSCSFYITYETPLACLPVPDAQQSNSCSVVDTKTGYTYDLMPLSDSNYRTSDRQGSIFIINLCKPVLYGKNSMCPPGASICFYSPKATDIKKRFMNFGTVNPRPTIDNDQLLLRHQSTTPCATNPSVNYTSVVSFHCSRTVMNAHPDFVGLADCTYLFNFITPLACKEQKSCTAVTKGNELLDLSPLSVLAPHKIIKDNKEYTFAVCNNAGKSCLNNNGACFTENGQTMSLGDVNSHLRFNQSGAPYLLYEGGSNCATGATKWTTKIEFVCANNATKDNGTGGVDGGGGGGKPIDAVKIIEDSNCQLLIQYQTPYACQKQIKCKVKVYVDHSTDSGGSGGTGGDDLFDLTPLISATNNYEANIDLPENMAALVPKTTKFFLNVCRPLVPKYQLGCAGGSSACMAKVTAAGAPEEEQSLGFPIVSLQAVNRTSAQLLYLDGDPCPTDKSSNLSTRIYFTCNMRKGRGQPVLRSISDCHYSFDWDTSVICPPHECTFNADTCELVQDDVQKKLNFKTAPFTNNGLITVDHKDTKLSVDICGLNRKAITDYSQDLVNIFFIYNAPGCGAEGKMNVQLRVICSNETHSSSTVSKDTQCNLLYEQRTPIICDFLGLNVPPSTSDPSDTTSTTTAPATPKTNAPTTSVSGTAATTIPTTTIRTTIATAVAATPAVATAAPAGSVGTILGAILSVTFCVVCVGLFAFSPSRRQRVRRLFRRTSSAVRSNEEANLLLEPNGEFTDSDDDMLL